MPRVTLDTLPEDLLDLVFQHLEDVLRTTTTNRLDTFCRLCVVNRALLSSARRFLYHDPLVPQQPEWRVDDYARGRLVRDLTGLHEWIPHLAVARLSAQLCFRTAGIQSAFAWCLDVLQACRSLTKVSIEFSDYIQLDSLLNALSPSLPTLRHIRLQFCTQQLVQLVVSTAGLQELEHLEIASFHAPDAIKTPQVPVRIRAVTTSLVGPLLAIMHCLPQQLSHFRSLTLLHIDPNTPPENLVELVKLIGPNLTTLSLDFGHSETLDIGSRIASSEPIPLELFSLLPRIRFLRLSKAKALSMERIERLASSSPYLVELDCRRSLWMADDPSLIDDRSEGWQQRICHQTKVAFLCRPLTRLQRVHLGSVPIAGGGRAVALEKAFAERGVEVGYETWWTG
ncbi:hypothetical protein JCM8097_007128 [Rhodosporidiobolus ruineniae]